jgi:AraC-like DNA-binding protein
VGRDEVTKMQAAVLLSIVRLFAPSNWTPSECGLTLEGGLGPMVREVLGVATIYRTPDYSWFRLPRSMLSCPPRALPPDPTPSGTAPDPALDLVGSLVQTVRPYLSRGAPVIRDAAGLAGTSVRSLQRELAREGSSYRDVVRRARFETSCKLLSQRDVKIVDVAHEAGFGDQAHFTRFFRSTAGVSPREYRASLFEGAA